MEIPNAEIHVSVWLSVMSALPLGAHAKDKSRIHVIHLEKNLQRN